MDQSNADGSARAQEREAGQPHLDSAALSAQIGMKLRFAQAAVWGDLIAAFKPFGMRPQHYAALSIVAASPGCTQQHIGTALRVSPSNLVALIDDLVAQKLVDRCVMPANRRANMLTISALGHARLEQLDLAHRKHQLWLASVLTPDERGQLIALLDKLTG